MNAAWFAGVLAISAGCTRPVQLVMAPVGARGAAEDAGPPRVARNRGAEETSLLGSWSGSGLQSDGGHWPVRVELTALSGRCATITYPSVPCRGVWLCEGEASADGWREAHETIESGACIDGGTFRYRVRSESLEWTWFKASAGRRNDEDSLTARGVLTRSNAPSEDENSKSWILEEEEE